MIEKIKIATDYVEYSESGKRHRKSFAKEKDLIRRKVEMQKFATLLKRRGEAMKTDIYIEVFQEYIEKNKKLWREKTTQTYLSKVNVYQKYLKEMGTSTTPATPKLFKTYMIEQGRSGKYINTFIELFSTICKEEGIENFFDTKKMRETTNHYKAFSKNQKQLILVRLKITDYQLYLSCLFMYYTFTRPQEFRQLRVKNIDFEQGTLFIPKAISKNKKDGIIKIPPHFLDELKTYIGEANPEDFIFCSKGGSTGPYMYQREALGKRHNKILKQMYIPGTYYQWKSTGILDAYLSGIPLVDIQRQARHHSLSQLQTYLDSFNLITSKSFDEFKI